jgi:hypothetical protein
MLMKEIISQIEDMKISELVEFLIEFVKDHTYIKVKNIATEYIIKKFNLTHREAILYHRKLRIRINTIIKIGLESNTIVKFNNDTYRITNRKELTNILKDFLIKGDKNSEKKR